MSSDVIEKSSDASNRRAAYEAGMAARRESLRTQLADLGVWSGESSARVLELGCGHGHFLTAYAEAQRQWACVGVDFCRDRIRRAERKRDRGRLRNLRFIHAEFSEFLDALSPDVKFRRVFVLFPDPWPKRRHRKHRICSPAFLTRLASITEIGAELHLRTDAEEFFREAAHNIEQHDGWHQAPLEWPFDCETVFQQKAARFFSLSALRIE